ncbi:MAG: DUF6691 family protein [Myxococcota bacterium]
MSGMTMPSKVIGFLDITGDWDPSLIFVMVGGIAVYTVLFQPIRRRADQGKNPLMAARFMIPSRRDINPRLVGGALLFGVGWGLGGFCPGPAIASLPTASLSVLIFVVAMAGGMGIWGAIERSLKSSAES